VTGSLVAVQGRVRGRVQGVFYRASMQAEASRLGLRGWVRNAADGSVEFTAAGPAQAVDALLAWARQGPPAARVDAVETASVDPATMPAATSFDVLC